MEGDATRGVCRLVGQCECSTRSVEGKRCRGTRGTRLNQIHENQKFRAICLKLASHCLRPGGQHQCCFHRQRRLPPYADLPQACREPLGQLPFPEVVLGVDPGGRQR